ncbi:MAG: CRISPR-associated helicase Cas3' [Candidatus Aenigmatarchaeota archaeon]
MQNYFLDIKRSYSHPRKILWNHINEIIWFSEELKKLGYDFDMNYLKIFAFFHDLGKTYIRWQKYLSGEIDKIKHSGISSLLFFLIASNREDLLKRMNFNISDIQPLYKFLKIDLSRLNKDIINLFTYLILVHHSSLKLIRRDGKDSYQDFFTNFENEKWKDIINSLESSGLSYISAVTSIKRILEKMNKEEKYKILDTYAIFKISDMLSGSFHRNLKREEIPNILYSFGISNLDYEFDSKEDVIKLLITITKSKEIDFNRLENQMKFLNENINILLAPTGFGKTTFSILKGIKNKRCIILLPTITAIKQFVDRTKSIIRELGYLENTIGTYYYFYNPFEEIGEDHRPTENYFLSRYLLKPLMITSIDQILLLYLQTKEYYIKKLALQNRLFIVDEIHLLSPKMLWLLIRFIDDNRYLFSDKNIVFMSATFTKYLRELLKEELPYIFGETSNKELLLYDLYPKNRIWIEDMINGNIYLNENEKERLFEEILNKIKDISSKRKDAKILVIFNTVRNAQEFYDYIKKQNFTNNIMLFHSRYIYKHRKEKEKKILNIKNKEASFILIATQVVEVSLDIDFDFLITEIAPLPDLIQRFGRVYRNRKSNELPPKYPNIYLFGFLKESENIYDKKLIEVTYEIMKDFSSSIVNERNLIEKLENSEFGKKFREEYDYVKKEYSKLLDIVLNDYSNYFFYIFSEDDEKSKEKIAGLLNIRDDINILAIIDPNLLEEKEKRRLKRLLLSLKESIKKRDFSEYFRCKLELRDYMLTIPFYYIIEKESKIKVKLLENYNIPVITGEDIYSKEYGLKVL